MNLTEKFAATESGIVAPASLVAEQAEAKKDADRKTVRWMIGDWNAARKGLKALDRYGVSAALLCQECKTSIRTVAGKPFVLRCDCTDRCVR